MDFAVNPGQFYASLTAGEITQAAFAIDSFRTPYRNRMIALKTGLGKSEGNHLFCDRYDG